MFGDSVLSGLATIVALTLLFFLVVPVGVVFPGASFLMLGFRYFGLTQLIYVVPVFIRLKATRPAAAKGLIIGAAIVAVFNVLAWPMMDEMSPPAYHSNP
jgi:hypothetical protein